MMITITTCVIWRALSRRKHICSTTVLGFIMMDQVPIGRIVLAFVWLFHILYFTFGVKNYKKDTAVVDKKYH